MSYFEIKGGTRLSGEIQVHGAKNSVLPILAASLLTKGETVLHNCPNLSDVQSTFDILRLLGCRVTQEGNTVTIDATEVTASEIPCHLMQEMRSSVLFLGALLARTKSAVLCAPGGCHLGPRPIDFHVSAFQELGVEILDTGDTLRCQCGTQTLGKEICLPFPSVGATENLMLLACGINGTTTIVGAAREPEIVDLQQFLTSMGARVTGAGSTVITIEGTVTLHPTEYRIMGDRIVATTYLSAAALTGGTVSLTGISAHTLTAVLSTFDQMGCRLSTRKSSLTLACAEPLQSVPPLRTAPYPGFPTDCQALLMATLTRSRGSTMFVENMFDSRYHHVDELRRMGANIEVSSRVAMVTGVPQLQGATVRGRDLRGTAALLVASLGAEGESRVFGLSHLFRGYERITEDLISMGARLSYNKETHEHQSTH